MTVLNKKTGRKNTIKNINKKLKDGTLNILEDVEYDKNKYWYNNEEKKLFLITTVFNKNTGKPIKLSTAQNYLNNNILTPNDLVYDKSKFHLNLYTKKFVNLTEWLKKKTNTKETENLLKKLPDLYRKRESEKGLIIKTIKNRTPLNQFGKVIYELNYTRGTVLNKLSDIVDWTNSVLNTNPNKFNGVRLIITTNYEGADGIEKPYYLTTKIIQGRNINLIDITEKLEEEYNGEPINISNVTVSFQKIPNGGGCVKVDSWIKKKTKSVCIIENDDDLCGQRCLVLSQCETARQRRELQGRTKKKYQTLLDEVCSYMGYGRLNFLDFEKYVNKYPEYSICIFGSLDTILYETENYPAEKIIYLFYDNKISHYHLITNVDAFINDEAGKYKWCFDCKKRMLKTTFKNHTCSALQCKLCKVKFDTKDLFTAHLKLSGTSDNCPKCNIKCRGECCYEKHIEKCNGENWFYDCCYRQFLADGYSKNEAIRKSWGRAVDKENHNCDYSFCKYCKEYLPRNHRCLIQPKNLSDKGLVNLIAFDFESWIDEETGIHSVMYIVAIDRLTYTINEWSGKNSLSQFVEWCLEKKNTTFIAHNGKAYDTWLIHYYICNNFNKRPDKIILAGQKIMYMKFKSNCFIDSLNHFACGLDDLTKTFGLDPTKYKKGFYPYIFNTPNNWDYNGEMPDVKYFTPHRMSNKKYKEFLKWYNEMKNNNYIWDHKKETKEYCISDVKLLLEACNVYSNIGYELTGLDPLHKQTIASWVMNIYLIHDYPFQDYPIGVLNKEEYDFIKRSFHGGRTECIRLYRGWSKEEVENGKYGRYVDIQSLYPTTQFYDKLPYGIPEWINFEEKTINENNYIINNSYGYFEVDIEMNKKLFMCPLVSKVDGKLQANVLDKHKEVFFSEELKEAIKDGCNIKRIYRQLKFKYTDQLFKSFVRKFLEIKVNNSGKPDFWSLPNRRKKWIDEHYERFGFKPNPTDKINSGMRKIAKMILNSLWGKFGQRPDMIKSEYIDPSNVKTWYKLLYLDKQDLIDIHSDVISGECLFVKYIDRRENSQSVLYSTNLALASAVTANASMRLYKELRLLQERVLYFDTDSIIYEYDKNKYNVPEGDYLGDWESETGDKPITEMCGTGAKSYSYKVNDEQVDCKMKGICLNTSNSKIVNFESLKYLIDNPDKKITTNENINFKKTEFGIITELFDKDIQYTMDKRDRIGYFTYPKGYEH